MGNKEQLESAIPSDYLKNTLEAAIGSVDLAPAARKRAAQKAKYKIPSCVKAMMFIGAIGALGAAGQGTYAKIQDTYEQAEFAQQTQAAEYISIPPGSDFEKGVNYLNGIKDNMNNK